MTDARGEAGARRLAGDRKAASVDADGPGHRGHALDGGDRVLDGGGIGVLRRQPVGHGHEAASGGMREARRERIMRLEITRDEAAAMEEDDARTGRRALVRDVEAGGARPRPQSSDSAHLSTAMLSGPASCAIIRWP